MNHKRTNTIWFHLYRESKTVKFTEAESRMVVSRGWGVGEMGNCYSVGKKF